MVLQVLNDSVVKLGDVSFTRNEYIPTFKDVKYGQNGEYISVSADSRLDIKRKFDGEIVFSVGLKDTNFYNSSYDLYTDYSLLLSDLVTSFSNIGQIQGAQGPAGPQGPVGPAGLNWQGAWVSGESYVEDDAVGYDGASWFCINATSGTDSPDVDVDNWALLASQGAVGPQGPQGPVGPQGPIGLTGPAGANGFSSVGIVKTTIKVSEVLNLFTTPITILNNLDFPGKFVYPLSIYIKRNAGNAYTLSTNSLSIINDFNTAIQSGAGINANPLQNTTVGYILQNIPVTQAISGAYQNTTYKLKANGNANPTGGTGSLEVYLTYVQITL
jgi:hypothetical protein